MSVNAHWYITRITQVINEYIDNTLLVYDTGFPFMLSQILIIFSTYKHRLDSSMQLDNEVLKLSSITTSTDLWSLQ